MKTLLQKEARELAPYWALALLLASVPVWLVGWPWTDWSGAMMALTASISLLCVVPLGMEFTHGTFAFMLAQPVPRRQFWLAKAGVLALALVTVVTAFRVSLALKLATLRTFDWWTPPQLSGWVVLIALAGLAGGLLFPLVFRQLGAALWFVPLVPIVSVATLTWLLGWDIRSPVGRLILLGYAVLVAGLGWKLFRSVEDAGRLGSLTLRWESLENLWSSRDSTRRSYRPSLALFRKELALHQVGIIVAAVTLVLHVVALILRWQAVQESIGAPALLYNLVWFLWISVAIILGAGTFAEERRMGTESGQLTQPVSRNQFLAVKVGTTLVLTLIATIVLPLLLEFTGSFFEVKSWLTEPIWIVVAIGKDMSAPTLLLFCHLTATLVALYASSVSRNTTQALGLTALIGVAIMTLTIFRSWSTSTHSNQWIYLFERVAWGITLPVGLWLTWCNCRQLLDGQRTRRRNLWAVSAVVLLIPIMTATGINRAWEHLLPHSPVAGKARISPADNVKICHAHNGRYLVLLPDGRIWVSSTFLLSRWLGRDEVRKMPTYEDQPSMFLPGSDWKDVAGWYSQTIALKEDGTLWQVIKRTSLEKNPEVSPQQIGSATNWVAISGDQGHFLALQDDGSLWGWGNNKSRQISGDLAESVSQPTRIGTENDWAEVFAGIRISLAKKQDGSLWKWGYSVYRDEIQVREPADHPVRHLSDQETGQIVYGDTIGEVYLTKDGHLQVAGHATGKLTLTRIEEPADWRTIDISWGCFAGAKKDGSLWVSPRDHRDHQYYLKDLRQIGSRKDWIAVHSGGNIFLALGADGDLAARWTTPGEYKDSGAGLIHKSRRHIGSVNVLNSR